MNLFFVKSCADFSKAASNYDILDPDTGKTMLHCREASVTFFRKIFRFHITIRTPSGKHALPAKRVYQFYCQRSICSTRTTMAGRITAAAPLTRSRAQIPYGDALRGYSELP